MWISFLSEEFVAYFNHISRAHGYQQISFSAILQKDFFHPTKVFASGDLRNKKVKFPYHKDFFNVLLIVPL